MSLSDGSGLSASDVLALTANNDGFGGNGFGGGWWLILFILMMFGGFGWGNNANNGAGNLAANNQMQTDTIMNFLNPPYARPFPPTTGTTTNG